MDHELKEMEEQEAIEQEKRYMKEQLIDRFETIKADLNWGTTDSETLLDMNEELDEKVWSKLVYINDGRTTYDHLKEALERDDDETVAAIEGALEEVQENIITDIFYDNQLNMTKLLNEVGESMIDVDKAFGE